MTTTQGTGLCLMMSQPVPYLPKARNKLYKKKIYLLPQRHHLPQGIHIPLEISLMILLYFLGIVVVIAFFEITSLINCTTVLMIIFFNYSWLAGLRKLLFVF